MVQKIAFVFFSFLIISTNVDAQKSALGSWNIMNVKYKSTEKLSFFGEAQIRSLKFYNNFHYFEYKGGVNYSFFKNAVFTLGLGSYQTFNEVGNFTLPKNNDEFRIWPQITLSQNIGDLKIEQRYRLESRFTSKGYRNRFRYRVNCLYAFGKNNSNFKPFIISVNNELFFTNKEPYFERNRLQASFMYKMNKNVAFQIGLLNQFDYKINDETGKNFLVVGCFFELNN
jgi:hypothetical protein